MLALLVGGERVGQVTEGIEVDVVLDRTPFYAESGGQVGDTGTITTAPGAVIDVSDTQYGLPGQISLHRGKVRVGTVVEGDEADAEIDGVRRDRIRRNHTATHVLHWALREVLGTHVQQAGSFVGPDRLRFDFSHHEPVTVEQLAQVERLANAQVISDAPVRHYETTKAEAERIGAIAFFGEKYGDIVRVLEAGPSTELCGGTHVHALGFIGPIKVVSESSIGSNLRRIEAMTGDGAFEYIEYEEQLLRRAGDLLRATPKEVPDRIERLSEQVRALAGRAPRTAGQGRRQRGRRPRGPGRRTALLVVRVDDLGTGDLKQLAQETVRTLGTGVVVLVGAADGKAAIAVAVSKDLVAKGASADAIAKPAVGKLGGGVGQGRGRGGRRRSERRRDRRGARRRAATWRHSGGRDGDCRNPRAGRRPRGTAHRPRAVGSVPYGRVAARCVAPQRRSGRRSPRDRRDRAREEGANVIVVGLPLSLSGRTGPAAARPRSPRSRRCRRSAATSRSSPTTNGSPP